MNYHIVYVKYDEVSQGENRKIEVYQDNWDGALARFYSEMNDIVTNQRYSHGYVNIEDDYGKVLKHDYYERSVEPISV